MRSRTPYEDRPVLRIVPADNDLGFTLEGDVKLNGGMLEVKLLGSPPADAMPEFCWEIVRKVNEQNVAIDGHHWSGGQFDFEWEVDQERTQALEVGNLGPSRHDPVFYPLITLTVEFRLNRGSLPESPPESTVEVATLLPIDHRQDDPG